jgi:hypothetical protein
MRHIRFLGKVALGLVLLSSCDAEDGGDGSEFRGGQGGGGGGAGYEVWLVDQSNSFGQSFGGAIYVYDGEDLQGSSASDAEPVESLDLADETAALCMANTGANPVRPHMIVFNSTDSHGILSFVVSGHVVIYDGPTHEPIACFRTQAGAGGARQAHAAFPTAGDDYIVVANQNGKLLERISTDYETGAFTQNPAATLDLANCTTPSGAPCQAAGLRPDNAPICPVPLPNGQVVVTLRGGGMFVVDPSTTPMSIVAEYDMDTVSGNGCGGTIVQDQLFITSGGGTPSNLYTYEVYSFPTSGFSASNPVNTPAPQSVDSDDADHRDAHGVTPARVSMGNAQAKYLWVADRGLGLITTYDATSYQIKDVIELADGHDDPDKLTPDLLDTNPSGNRVFASLRGPNPLSGDAHVSVGSQPGLGIFKVKSNGAKGDLMAVVPISNVDAGGVERADAHGVQVRRK